MERDEYHQKMLAMLTDDSTYKKIGEYPKSDPTPNILRKQGILANSWLAGKHINEKQHFKLKVSSANLPRIYGLPKIHKPERPLRPVVSTIGSATYCLAQFLAKILGKVVGKSIFHVRNSFDFAEEISTVQIPLNAVLFSLDVTSLFTNVPLDLVLVCIDERWGEIEQHTSIERHSLVAAIKLVMESTFFVYNKVVYKQCYGVPMGSPLSGILSELTLEKLENECLRKLQEKQIDMIFYRRYVDDCFCIGVSDQIPVIQETFNDFHNKLQFTIEQESGGKIKFLDMQLTRNNEKIQKTWLPKQNCGRYLDFESESPYTHKRNTVIALTDRAIKLTDATNRPQMIEKVKNILKKNNYPTYFTESIIKDRVHKHYNTLQNNKENGFKRYVSTPYVPCLSEKLQKILVKHDMTLATKPKEKIKHEVFTKMKDPIPKEEQRNVVYSIPCKDCQDLVYIGQTGRMLGKRLQEHEKLIAKNEPKSGLAQHAIEAQHCFDFKKPGVLERNLRVRETREAAETLHIQVRGKERTSNQQTEVGKLATYNGLIAKLRGETVNKPTSSRTE